MRRALRISAAFILLLSVGLSGSLSGGLFGQEALSTKERTEKGREVLKYGTDAEINNLIKDLQKKNNISGKVEYQGYLDKDLVELAKETGNSQIKGSLFAFFTALEKKGLEEAALDLIEKRENAESANIIQAIEYLGKIKHKEAQNSLRALLETNDEQFSGAAIKAIGAAVGPDNAGEAAQYLIEYYEKAKDESQREILLAIGETNSKAATAFLNSLIETSERPVIVMAALAAAAKISDDDSIDAVINAVSSKDPNIRAEAVEALGGFSGGKIEKAVLDAFRDSFFRARLGAIKAAGKRKLRSAVPYLKFRVENDDVPALREEALRSLAAIGGGEAEELLEKIFDEKKSPDKLKVTAAELLMTLNANKYAEKIITALDGAKKLNQKQLYNGFISALAKEKTDRLKPLVTRLYASTDSADRVYALEFTAINGFSSFKPEVQRLAEDKNSNISRRAKEILEKL